MEGGFGDLQTDDSWGGHGTLKSNTNLAGQAKRLGAGRGALGGLRSRFRYIYIIYITYSDTFKIIYIKESFKVI